MRVAILMGGRGQRFLAAGYTVPKPLLEVDGMPIVEHIVRNFSPEDEFLFAINEEHLGAFPIQALLRRIAPLGKVVPVPYIPEGPVAVLMRLLPHLPDEEPVVVNYSDFSWIWDYPAFLKRVRETHCDGAVACYRGFHPHLLGPNTYATIDAEGAWMRAIREKHSWHADKTEDWTSSGTYYFRKAEHLRRFGPQLLASPELKISGETYVSQIYPFMAEAGLKVLVYEIPRMLQWGTPQDLEHYRYWSAYFHAERSQPPQREPIPMTVLMLMAGAGTRFAQAGYAIPKPFIPADGLPMVVRATQGLPHGSRYVFATRQSPLSAEGEKHLGVLFPESKLLQIPELTRGQACTALLVKGSLPPEEALLIGACDHGVILNLRRFRDLTAAETPVDALIFTTRGNPDVARHPERYGWVKTGEGTQALRVSVKIPLSVTPEKDHAVVGAFWFKKARYFTEHAEAMVRADQCTNGEFYIDECMNRLIQAGLKVHVMETDFYASWGTPDDLRVYNYWAHCFGAR